MPYVLARCNVKPLFLENIFFELSKIGLLPRPYSTAGRWLLLWADGACETAGNNNVVAHATVTMYVRRTMSFFALSNALILQYYVVSS